MRLAWHLRLATFWRWLQIGRLRARAGFKCGKATSCTLYMSKTVTSSLGALEKRKGGWAALVASHVLCWTFLSGLRQRGVLGLRHPFQHQASGPGIYVSLRRRTAHHRPGRTWRARLSRFQGRRCRGRRCQERHFLPRAPMAGVRWGAWCQICRGMGSHLQHRSVHHLHHGARGVRYQEHHRTFRRGRYH